MRKTSAKSFVTIMIVVAVLALLLRIVIDSIIKFNITQNESNAQGTLKLISAALENYSKDHNGIYPVSLSALTKSKPAYLDKDYNLEPTSKGYNYGCSRLDASGYSCFASPNICKLTGKVVYTVASGSLLVSQDCEKKE
jgi:competence protein ComGC